MMLDSHSIPWHRDNARTSPGSGHHCIGLTRTERPAARVIALMRAKKDASLQPVSCSTRLG